MLGRNRRRPEDTAEMRNVRDRATAESWPMNHPHADYAAATWYREIRLEGVALAQPVADEEAADAA